METQTTTVHDIVRPSQKTYYRLIKRLFDIAFSLGLGILTLLPMLLVLALIWLKDRGNPLYFHSRVGKDGNVINVAKCRSMKLGADRLEDMLTPEQLAQYRQEYKVKDDPRLIGWAKPGDGNKCFGGIIRKLSIDELPQIMYNVLIKGNMSIVGPRPILKEELAAHYTPEEQQKLLSVKPGLTGYWQANARNDATYETGERQRMELYYVDHCGLAWTLRSYSIRSRSF